MVFSKSGGFDLDIFESESESQILILILNKGGAVRDKRFCAVLY